MEYLGNLLLFWSKGQIKLVQHTPHFFLPHCEHEGELGQPSWGREGAKQHAMEGNKGREEKP